MGDSGCEVPVTRRRAPRVSRGRRAGLRSGDDDATGSQESHRAADEAMTALYHTHCRSLVRIAVLLTGDSRKAEEIVQDAFAATHRAWPRVQDGDKALGYLRHAVVTRARSQRAVPSIPSTPLVAVLSTLPDLQREALVLKYYADWPGPQIAAAMGISRHALNAHIRRGMSALQTCLARDWGGGI
jgi:DNA-directed RNA polymerase specialized sigma24 family protein